MKTPSRLFITLGIATLTAGLSCLTAAPGDAENKNEANKDKKREKARSGILKVADLLEKNDLEAAKKEAAVLAQDKEMGLEEIMELFNLRSKHGLGLGPKAGVIKPDGIEDMMLKLERKTSDAKDLTANAEALTRSTYVIAAIAEVTLLKCPVDQKVKNKDPKDWAAWTEDMRKASMELADAVKAKKPQEVKNAAKKLNATCVNCHDPFKEV